MRGQGGTISVLFELHWDGRLCTTWERELDLQAFRRHIRSYWAAGPGQYQPHTRQYQHLRTIEAAREIARRKDERYLPGLYLLITGDIYRARFLSAPLPIGAFIWYHSLDGSWWLGKVKQQPNVLGRYIIRFLNNPGPALIELLELAYITTRHSTPLVALGAFKHTAVPTRFKAFHTASRRASYTLTPSSPFSSRRCHLRGPGLLCLHSGFLHLRHGLLYFRRRLLCLRQGFFYLSQRLLYLH